MADSAATKYDYLNGDMRVLTADGETAHITMCGKLGYPSVLLEAGQKGYLKGKALQDYLALTKEAKKTAKTAKAATLSLFD